MLQTVELSDYKECKEYAVKQVWVLDTHNEKDATSKPAFDLDLNGKEDKRNTKSEEHPAQGRPLKHGQLDVMDGKERGQRRERGVRSQGRNMKPSQESSTMAERWDTRSASAGRRTP